MSDCSQAKQIAEKIVESVAAPRKATGDSGSVEMHSLKEQLEAARYFAGRCAVRRRGRGLMWSKVIPPGAGEMS